MEPTRKKTLSSTDICEIIKTSSQFGVSSLKFGDVEIQFGQKSATTPIQETTPVTEITEKDHERMNKESLEEQEADLRQAQLDQMQIEDPARYEQLIANGELDARSDAGADGEEGA